VKRTRSRWNSQAQDLTHAEPITVVRQRKNDIVCRKLILLIKSDTYRTEVTEVATKLAHKKRLKGYLQVDTANVTEYESRT